jgi:hypothetical protein
MRFVEIIRRNGVPINGSIITVEAGLYQKPAPIKAIKNGIPKTGLRRSLVGY